MKNKDIVYILSNEIDNNQQELIYSLRSVEKNFPHHNVWFYGGAPSKLKPDFQVSFLQYGRNRWFKVYNCLKDIIFNKGISDDFFLFNDDFFIMEPISNFQNGYDGNILDYIKRIENKFSNITSYTNQLRLTQQILLKKECTLLNYSIHIPMLINKEAALKTMYAFPEHPMFRNLYGNFNRIGGTQMEDPKIKTLDGIKFNGPYVSTSDRVFKEGEIGKLIRNTFQEKSRFEV